VRFLAEAEQVRIYGRFKLFLDGLSFPLKCISLVEMAHPERDPALVAQREVLSQLATTPHLQEFAAGKSAVSARQATALHDHQAPDDCLGLYP